MAMARTLSRDAWRSSILWTSACRSPGTTATALPLSRSHIPVHMRPGRRTQKPSRPRKTWGCDGAEITACASSQLLSTSPSLTPSSPPPPGPRLPHPPRRPAPGAARWIGLREHLAALPATEPALEQHQPYFLSPELRVPLPLHMPLVNLPRGAPTSRTGRLFLPALRRHLYPSGPLLDTKHLQPRQPQPNRDRVVLHLASFLQSSLAFDYRNARGFC